MQTVTQLPLHPVPSPRVPAEILTALGTGNPTTELVGALWDLAYEAGRQSVLSPS